MSAAAETLQPLTKPAPASSQLGMLTSFLESQRQSGCGRAIGRGLLGAGQRPPVACRRAASHGRWRSGGHRRSGSGHSPMDRRGDVRSAGGTHRHSPARRSGREVRRIRSITHRRPHRGGVAGAAAPQHLLLARSFWRRWDGRRSAIARSASARHLSIWSRRHPITSSSRRSRSTTRRWSSRRLWLKSWRVRA